MYLGTAVVVFSFYSLLLLAMSLSLNPTPVVSFDMVPPMCFLPGYWLDEVTEYPLRLLSS